MYGRRLDSRCYIDSNLFHQDISRSTRRGESTGKVPGSLASQKKRTKTCLIRARREPATRQSHSCWTCVRPRLWPAKHPATRYPPSQSRVGWSCLFYFSIWIFGYFYLFFAFFLVICFVYLSLYVFIFLYLFFSIFIFIVILIFNLLSLVFYLISFILNVLYIAFYIYLYFNYLSIYITSSTTTIIIIIIITSLSLPLNR